MITTNKAKNFLFFCALVFIVVLSLRASAAEDAVSLESFRKSTLEFTALLSSKNGEVESFGISIFFRAYIVTRNGIPIQCVNEWESRSGKDDNRSSFYLYVDGFTGWIVESLYGRKSRKYPLSSETNQFTDDCSIGFQTRTFPFVILNKHGEKLELYRDGKKIDNFELTLYLPETSQDTEDNYGFGYK